MARIHIQGNGLKAKDGDSLRGTTESLAGQEGESSGSELELNGFTETQADKYGFTGGSQQGIEDPWAV